MWVSVFSSTLQKSGSGGGWGVGGRQIDSGQLVSFLSLHPPYPPPPPPLLCLLFLFCSSLVSLQSKADSFADGWLDLNSLSKWIQWILTDHLDIYQLTDIILSDYCGVADFKDTDWWTTEQQLLDILAWYGWLLVEALFIVMLAVVEVVAMQDELFY